MMKKTGAMVTYAAIFLTGDCYSCQPFNYKQNLNH